MQNLSPIPFKRSASEASLSRNSSVINCRPQPQSQGIDHAHLHLFSFKAPILYSLEL